jgi:hypothetical protein
MRIALIALLAAAGIAAGTAFAQSPAGPPVRSKAPAAQAATTLTPAAHAAAAPTAARAGSVKMKAVNGKRGRGRRHMRTAQANNGKAPGKAQPAQDALASCIAMWDRRTHMTRRQWARACRRVAERLKDMRVK